MRWEQTSKSNRRTTHCGSSFVLQKQLLLEVLGPAWSKVKESADSVPVEDLMPASLCPVFYHTIKERAGEGSPKVTAVRALIPWVKAPP